jgi:hypothetical protein
VRGVRLEDHHQHQLLLHPRDAAVEHAAPANWGGRAGPRGCVPRALHMLFESPAPKELNQRIFETIYHGALKASTELAEKEGPYETCEGSPVSKGELKRWTGTSCRGTAVARAPSLQGGESAQVRASGVGCVCGMRSGACPHTPRTLRIQGRHHRQRGWRLHLLHQREPVTKINTPESKLWFRELTKASLLDPWAISWRP